MPRIHCPYCKCVLRRTERLMVLGVNRRMAGAARQCPDCRKWYLLPYRLVYVRMLPDVATEAGAESVGRVAA